MPLPSPRGVRVDPAVWDGSLEALRALEAPRRVVVVVRPGMTRTDAIAAFLRALTRRPPQAGR